MPPYIFLDYYLEEAGQKVFAGKVAVAIDRIEAIFDGTGTPDDPDAAWCKIYGTSGGDILTDCDMQTLLNKIKEASQ